MEEGHAEFWRRQLDRIGVRAQHLGLGWRTRALAWLARRFGPQLILPTVNTLEQRDVGQYDDQAEAVAHGLPAAERSHARIVRAIEAVPSGGLPGSALARLEGRHRALGGNALRAAVLGANDGLVSNLSLVMGVAGANAAEKTILLTGLAGLAAGACSMAMGEWLSVNSSRELAQRQIDIEAAELEQSPEEEIEEITLIYEAKGLARPQAEALARQMMGNRQTALDTLVREELGIDPQELGGSAWVAAASSFLLFSLGAMFPVLPFFFLSGATAILASLGRRGRRARRDRRRDLAVHRPRACLFRHQAAADRVRRRGAYLRDWPGCRSKPRRIEAGAGQRARSATSEKAAGLSPVWPR